MSADGRYLATPPGVVTPNGYQNRQLVGSGLHRSRLSITWLAASLHHDDLLGQLHASRVHTVRRWTRVSHRSHEQRPRTCLAHVKFKVSGNVCDPNYKLKDGDAAFLEAGTPIYQVNGHTPSAELAASFNGSLVLYKAMAAAP